MNLEKLFKDLEKVQDALYSGDFSGAKTILYAVMVDVKAAEQSVHLTGGESAPLEASSTPQPDSGLKADSTPPTSK